jgi:hypothetical protein
MKYISGIVELWVPGSISYLPSWSFTINHI